ncbi:MAG: hypothetical protein MJ134_09860 [Lachnospiraceae bacterium]|nr:hypothetical protein [Lachnospiraceae bacterium]
MELKKRKIIIVVLLALTLFVSLPVLTPYLVPGLDLKFHLYRIEGIVAGLKTGQIPVRMQPEWLSGYGYPVSIFYSDFFLYWPAFFRILHVNLQDCYKIYVITVNLLTIYLAFISFKGIFKDDTLIGVIGSVLWSTSIYRLGCEYARAGVGEYTALAFIPLFFWGGYQILYQPNKKNSWCITGVGFACLALSHLEFP